MSKFPSTRRTVKDKEQVDAQTKKSRARHKDCFPFVNDLSKYPITRDDQFPIMPIELHCIRGDLHLGYHVLMSDGLYLGEDDEATDFRIDHLTVSELEGKVPLHGHDPSLDVRRQFYTQGRMPNDEETTSTDREYDITLSIDSAHPFNLTPLELVEYIRKLQIFFKRSTTPKDDVVSDFDNI